jgi:hypothetical protein
VAIASGLSACSGEADPQEAYGTPDAWISIHHGAPPRCFVAVEEHDEGEQVLCASVGQYLTTKGLPQGAKARITAYNSGGIAWPEVRIVIDSLTASGYVNAGIFTPKVGFVRE